MESNNKVIYSNNAEFISSTYDLGIVFKLNAPNSDNEITTVFMSWQHAKKFIEILNKNLEEYELLYSKVSIEPNQEYLDKMKEEGKIAVVDKKDGE